MKISFPKYGPGELLINERGARCIISSVIIGFFAGLCGSYLLQNKFWLLTIALVGIAGIVLCLATPSAHINENVPRITSQWDYRPKKPVRAPAVFDGSGAEASEVMSPDPFGTNNNVWFSGDSLEGAAPTFINGQPDAEELMPKIFSETTDPVCTAPTVDEAAVSTYD